MTRAKDISKILTDADISGNIDVDGVTNLDVVDIDGAVDMASTLKVDGNVGIFTSSGLSALSTDAKMLQINGSYLIHFDNDASGTTSLSNNMFFDGSNNKSLYTGQASQYYQNIGEHYFRTAPSNGANATLSPVTVMKIDNTGAVTMPLQPAFLAMPNAVQDNVAEGADVLIVFGSERFDNNSDFSSNTFTAPVTGRYFLSYSLFVQAVDNAPTYFETYLVTSNRTYNHTIDPRGFDADPLYWTFNQAIVADMDAGDTAQIKINIHNGGTVQTDINNHSYFSGYLVC